MPSLRTTALLVALAIAGLTLSLTGGTAMAAERDMCQNRTDCAYNAKDAYWRFTDRGARQDCVKRVIWLRPGHYNLQMFVDRWKAHLVSDWHEGAKRSSIRSFRVPAWANYVWSNCASYVAPTKGVFRPGGRYRSLIDIDASLTPRTPGSPAWAGWRALGASSPSWATTSMNGTYHFGSAIRWIGP